MRIYRKILITHVWRIAVKKYIPDNLLKIFCIYQCEKNAPHIVIHHKKIFKEKEKEMRKRFLPRALALSMAATMMLTSMPVNAAQMDENTTAVVQEAEDTQTTETSEVSSEMEPVTPEVSASTEAEANVPTTTEKDVSDDQTSLSTDENATTDSSAPTTFNAETRTAAEQEQDVQKILDQLNADDDIDATYVQEDAPDLYDIDIKKDSVDSINKAILLNNDGDVAAWVSTLSEDEIQVLLDRDTLLAQPKQLGTDICKTHGLTAGKVFKQSLDYYKQVKKCSNHVKVSWGATSGYVAIANYAGTAYMNWSGFKKGATSTNRQTGLASSLTGGGAGSAVCLAGAASQTLSVSGGNPVYVWAALVFNKPAGYYGTGVSITGRDPGGHISVQTYANETSGTLSYANDYANNNASTGATSESFYIIANSCFNVVNAHPTITLGIAATQYNVNLEGSVSRHTFGDGWTLPGHAGKTSTVTFNSGNGTTVNPVSASHGFVAWNCPGAGNKGVGASVQDWIASNGQTIAFSPVYEGAKAVTLAGAPAARTFTVTYNTNGGSSVGATSGKEVFKGWKYPDGRIFGAGGAILVNGDVNMVGQWDPASVKLAAAPTKNITVSYNTAGGSVVNQQKESLKFGGWKSGNTTYTAGQTISLSSNTNVTAQWGNASVKLATAPTRAGYTFGGWKVGNTTYKAGDTISLSADTAVAALWTANTYTVQYDLNGGKMMDEKGDIASVSATYDQAFNITDRTPMKGDTADETASHKYSFIGWSTVAGALSPEFESNASVKNLTDVNGGVVTLYAVYKDDKTQIIKTPDDKPVPPNQDIDITEITQQINGLMDKLNQLTATAQLTQSDISQLKTTIQKLFGISEDTASKLVDFIKSCGLSDEVKIRILQHLANGYLTDQDKADLLNAIRNSSMSDSEKNQLIEAINSFTSLTFDQQKKLLDSLNSGSSVEWKVGGITYVLTKNADGTISVGIKDLGGVADLVIPNSVTIAGNTYPITTITPGAFKGNTILKTVTIPSNVSTIGDSAFEGCKNLTTVNVQKGLVTIGNKAFKDCTSLAGFSCPETLKTIGDSAFENCVAMKYITLNDGLVTIGKRAFYGCKSLTKIAIPKTVIKIGASAFAKCVKLKKVTFLSFSESQLTSVGTGVFAYDKALKSIKIPSKVRVIPKKTFFKCTKLAKVTGMKRVATIGQSAFEGCKSLKSITLQDRTQLITSKAFYGCSKLKTVTIKSKGLTKVGTKAFKKCKKNIKIKCPNSKVKSYTKLLKGKY